MYPLDLDYDWSRKYMLHGRPFLINKLVKFIKSSGSEEFVWVDIGCGTVKVAEEVIKLIGENNLNKYFKHIYLVDISQNMCTVTQRRFKHLSNIITVHCGDVVEMLEDKKIFKLDLASFSYSLSMIPTYENILNKLSKYENLTVAVADFSIPSRDSLKDRLIEWWFSLDKVHLGPERKNLCLKYWESKWSISSRKRIGFGFPLEVPFGLDLYSRNVIANKNQIECNYPEGISLSSDLWLFLDNFLYSFTIEDPLTDLKYLDVKETDRILMLTNGGDNVLFWSRRAKQAQLLILMQHKTFYLN